MGLLPTVTKHLSARSQCPHNCAQTRTNAIAWNPMEPMNLTLASEDCNLYTYDMRRLQSALCVHKVFTPCSLFILAARCSSPVSDSTKHPLHGHMH